MCASSAIPMTRHDARSDGFSVPSPVLSKPPRADWPGKNHAAAEALTTQTRFAGSSPMPGSHVPKNARAHHVEVIGGGRLRPDLLIAEQIALRIARVIAADGKAAVDRRHGHQRGRANSGCALDLAEKFHRFGGLIGDGNSDVRPRQFL